LVGKICDMEGVRGGDSGFSVQLCCEEDTNRLVVRAINEGGFACTDVDLFDLVAWLRRLAPGAVDVDAVTRALGERANRHEAHD
jgi:hypothetical protein